MKENLKKYFIVVFAVIICLSALSKTAWADPSSLTADQKAQLEQQLQNIQSQIAQLQQQMDLIEGQKNTLQNKLKQLQTQQKTLSLQIQSTNLQLSQLNSQILQAQNNISQDQMQVQQQQGQIAEALQLINQQDSHPLIYTILADKNLSSVYNDMQNSASIGGSLSLLVDQAQEEENQLNNDINLYQQKQNSAQNFLSIQTLQQQQLAASQDEQNTLLQQTKGRESDYQIAISGTQAQAAQIEAQLYQLAGGSSANVTFGQAAKIAQGVSAITGVPEAFLLAILTQESNLGQNVGTCNRPGDPPSKSWKVVMNPNRDQQPFLQITSSLGMDPDITPVSCPMHRNGRQIGWGGAMGPAQFIPSTWIAYIPQIQAITGSAPNPWNINDAFIAAAIKLKADGADGTRQGDWNSAMRYFSGSTNPAYSFYGDNVLSLTDKYQNELQTIANNS